jgi:hypothetical protein
MEQEQTTIAAEKELTKLVANADQSLEGFIALGQSFNLQLDYSIESLDDVEKLLVTFKIKSEFEAMKADAWLYIGQCICKSLGGQWKVSNDLKSYRKHYMLPVVSGFSKFNDEYCPMIEIDKFLDYSKKSFFKTTIQAMCAGTYRDE